MLRQQPSSNRYQSLRGSRTQHPPVQLLSSTPSPIRPRYTTLNHRHHPIKGAQRIFYKDLRQARSIRSRRQVRRRAQVQAQVLDPLLTAWTLGPIIEIVARGPQGTSTGHVPRRNGTRSAVTRGPWSGVGACARDGVEGRLSIFVRADGKVRLRWRSIGVQEGESREEGFRACFAGRWACVQAVEEAGAGACYVGRVAGDGVAEGCGAEDVWADADRAVAVLGREGEGDEREQSEGEDELGHDVFGEGDCRQDGGCGRLGSIEEWKALRELYTRGMSKYASTTQPNDSHIRRYPHRKEKGSTVAIALLRCHLALTQSLNSRIRSHFPIRKAIRKSGPRRVHQRNHLPTSEPCL